MDGLFSTFFSFSAEFYYCKRKNFRTHHKLINNNELIWSMHMVIYRWICTSTCHTIFNMMHIGSSTYCKWLSHFTSHICISLK